MRYLILGMGLLWVGTLQGQTLRQRVEDIENELIKARLQARVIALEQELVTARKEINAYRETTAGLLSRVEQLERLMQNQQPKAAEPLPKDAVTETDNLGAQVALHPTMIEFEVMTHDFGVIGPTEEVQYTFIFTNTGKNPLTIERAFGSCGCTVPEWKKEPIQPGAQGELIVKFDPKDKKGAQQKIVTVIANTIPSQTQLYIKATIGK